MEGIADALVVKIQITPWSSTSAWKTDLRYLALKVQVASLRPL
jgi:hypothetical protein